MLDFLTNHIAELANIVAILTPTIGFLIWAARRVRLESKEIREEMKAMNVRIDHMYQVMLEMLRKS